MATKQSYSTWYKIASLRPEGTMTGGIGLLFRMRRKKLPNQFGRGDSLGGSIASGPCRTVPARPGVFAADNRIQLNGCSLHATGIRIVPYVFKRFCLRIRSTCLPFFTPPTE